MKSRDTLVQELFDAMGLLMRRMALSREQWTNKHDLSKQQLHALYMLCRGPLTVGEFAAMLGITSSAVTQMIDHLEKKGLTERQADGRDRRVIRVALSTEGQQLAKEIKRLHLERIRRLLSGLDEPDIEQLITLLHKAEAGAKQS